jgi:long-subunit acyl-CoA synthetase (AMP-forming)
VPIPGVRPRDLATLLFTSGTTGVPKGIRFSQRNIVYKRFCRALALPEIGEDDEFLCYLPLFHTFGRWFEMTGCLFWGLPARR